MDQTLVVVNTLLHGGALIAAMAEEFLSFNLSEKRRI
ncbi:unnamed protein product [Brassica napus]|uniref:(rape) hypothetical protein n=1 Tax=Brassica napus TaxID=3708 RepID=A0A816RAU5_BRANA|nr:unnamed protein product [Brassica napus]